MIEKQTVDMSYLRPLLIALVSSAALAAAAGIRVTDASDGSPVDAVAVFDSSGRGLGVTAPDGSLPADAAGVSPLLLRHVAFEPLEVAPDTLSGGIVSLEPRTFVLPEVNAVSNPEYIRVEGYSRSYSSFGNDSGMGSALSEGTVVFYLKPDGKGKAKDGGKRYGYVVYDHVFSKSENVDTLRVRNGKQGGDMTDMMDEGLRIPLLVETKEFAAADASRPFTEIPGKHSPLGTIRNNGTTITVSADKLSDHKDHRYTPALLKMLGLTADCTEWTNTQTYDATATRPFDITSLVSTSCNIRIRGRGRLLKKMFGGEEVDMRITTEMFVTDISYLDKAAAKEAREADRLIETRQPPSTIPPLDPIAASLKSAALASQPK